MAWRMNRSWSWVVKLPLNMRKHAMEQIRKLGSDNIILTSMKSAEEEQASTTHSHMSIYGLTYEDYRRLSESFKNIRQTAPAKLMRKESS